MNNIEVQFYGTDLMVIYCNGYDEIIDLLKHLNNGVTSLSTVLQLLELDPTMFDDMLSLPASNYFILPTNAKDIKITTFNNTINNRGFCYKVVLPEFMPVVLPDIKKEANI